MNIAPSVFSSVCIVRCGIDSILGPAALHKFIWIADAQI